MSEADKDRARSEFLRFVEIVEELRRSCSWDKAQTPSTLVRYLIEEAYETVAAIDDNDPAALADELGDLLLQVVLQATIAAESGSFDLPGLIRNASDKLVRRHPHVFAGAEARDAEAVVARWEEIKRGEREDAGMTSALDGIPSHLPALLRAEKLGARARSAGMDWPDLRAALNKVREEIDEVERELDQGRPELAAQELGDALLALGNAPRFLGTSAEDTLRRACDKFIYRFKLVEDEVRSSGRSLSDLAPAEVDAAWERAKRRAK